MKRYKIVFSEIAKKDLADIDNFVTEISSKDNAERVVSKIAKRVRKLDIFPERSEPITVGGDGELVRVVISGKYRVFYVVDNSDREVVIVRVVSASRKMPRLK